METEQIAAAAQQAIATGDPNAIAGRCAFIVTGLLMDGGLGFPEAAGLAIHTEEHFRMIFAEGTNEDLHLVAFEQGDKLRVETRRGRAAADQLVAEMVDDDGRSLVINLSWVARAAIGSTTRKNNHAEHHRKYH